MSRRRSLILAIVMAGCWIALLAIIRSEFKLAKHLRSKDRSAQASVNLPSRSGPIHYLSPGSHGVCGPSHRTFVDFAC